MKKILIKIRQLFWGFNVKRVAKKCGKQLKVSHKSKVTKYTTLGTNVSFNGMRISGGGNVSIGDNFHSGVDCIMISQNHNYEGNAIPYDDTYIIKDIIIEDNVWLGDRVIVLGGSVIREGAIIQAGSVVCGEIPKCSISGGHPAKPFSWRNEEHYEQMKREKRFH